ncbi:hypothetical protein C0Z01_00395 [Photobacterium kishitanii]|nr:hypothetical protein AYY22_01940 [Photobacterium kishitanii]PSW71497.1 hypothetical protein C0Z01_00395 [Photobacterium kishitanii]
MRSVIERGRQILTGDVILAVFGKVQHKMPLGMDLLMAKYVHDTPAANRIIYVMATWLNDESLKCKDLAMALNCAALDVVVLNTGECPSCGGRGLFVSSIEIFANICDILD